MDKTNTSDISDALAWAETGRKQSEKEITNQIESFEDIENRRFISLSGRITQLEKEVSDLQRIVKELIG